jgi:hypothetical protein
MRGWHDDQLPCGRDGGHPALFLLFAMTSGLVLAEDHSKYRDFHLGADLPTIVKQTNRNQSQVKIVHQRPALIQELEWERYGVGASSTEDAARDVVFSFYDGRLLGSGSPTTGTRPLD